MGIEMETHLETVKSWDLKMGTQTEIYWVTQKHLGSMRGFLKEI